MDGGPDDGAATLRAVVEQILAAALDRPVHIRSSAVLPDHANVYRFFLDAPAADTPASVIVKRAPNWHAYDPQVAAFPAPGWFLFNNWAGSQFLHESGEGNISPRFYGGDRATGLIIVEDLGAGAGLHNLLLGSDPLAAKAGLIQLAALVGRMHARTIGREAQYNLIRDGLAPQARTEFYTYAWMASAWNSTLATLALRPAAGSDGELRALIAAMQAPGPFLAYTHGDPCPDNVLQVDGALKLIDFDVGAFRHALTDGVYGRLHFPTCWCVNRLPAQLPVEMEQAYRAELVQGCPAAGDDGLFKRAVVEACVYWAISMLHFTPIADVLREDSDWGIASLRQRYLLRLPIVAQVTEEYGHLEALGATLRTVAATLQTRWQTEAVMLPYPAFR